jgi:hypothetical protein
MLSAKSKARSCRKDRTKSVSFKEAIEEEILDTLIASVWIQLRIYK